MTTKEPTPSMERPLEGNPLRLLMAGATGAVLLLYGFFLVWTTLLAIWIAAEFALFVIGLRFGFAGLIGGMLSRDVEVLVLFARSFMLRNDEGARVILNADEAPRLFAIVNDLSRRAQVAPPDTVSVELSSGAWVRLEGFRRGTGKTLLGIGYDLLAGLTESEIRAVLAHEISHAKLIERGLRNWLTRGLRRSSQLAHSLFALREKFRRGKHLSGIASLAFQCADWHTRLIARLFAACSRQDEYAADRGSAELSGTPSVRSALSKLETLQHRASRLPWAERVARLQSEGGFSRWLIHELTAPSATTPSVNEAEDLFDSYATHPSVQNRLAALPEIPATTPEVLTPGLGLLGDSDAVAERLVAEIQRLVARKEEEDSLALNKWAKKEGRKHHLDGLQALGSILMICGILAIPIVAFAGELTWALVALFLAIGALGWAGYKYGGRRDKLVLPIPEFARLKEAAVDRKAWTREELTALEKELIQLGESHSKGSKRAMAFAAEAYKALGDCAYVRARIASMLALKEKKESLEGHLALAISAAARRETDLSIQAIQFVKSRINITRGSAAWGTAWTLMMLGDWPHAEGVLTTLLYSIPGHATLLAVHALCQSRQGKIQSAVVSARKAVAIHPSDETLRRFLIDFLISAGLLREAMEHIGPTDAPFAMSREMVMAQLRIKLLTQDRAGADQLVETLIKGENPGWDALRAGQFFEQARLADRARELYALARSFGHIPEARMGLARLHVQSNEKAAAKLELLAALDLLTPTATGSAGSAALFGSIVAELRTLEAPLTKCELWVAHVSEQNTPPAIAGLRVWVYGSNLADAQQRFAEILAALQPKQPPLLAQQISWQFGPKEQQPDRPTLPGILLP